jgi:hypothetical protein
LVARLQDLGFGGKTIYVPARDRALEDASDVATLLEAMAEKYERQGVTFRAASGNVSKRAGLKVEVVMALLGCGHRIARRLRTSAKKKWDAWFDEEGRAVKGLLEELREVPDSTVLTLYRKARGAVRQQIDPLTVLVEPDEMPDLERRHARAIARYAQQSVDSFPQMKAITKGAAMAAAAALGEVLGGQGPGRRTTIGEDNPLA